ncbi:DJ-1/PfpI family protein [Acuticoccus sp. I52.16.1]|uniref:DJ-1/PfpI family protein n=1 Tax=Acuticoccus sp. I52.16.1 TaxID=2928472 RepID=UPI001FD0DFFB|nr:DJ-1/PfpI family protein [Acuticoccus sp. I52.16.1]UOM37245.1 DJ-1/PfpI family protein [Acuticoccus sp. I52.16.1]
MAQKKQIGLLVFPNITQLDMTGPLQVFCSVAEAEVHLVWKTTDPVPSDTSLVITPTITLADCPQLDLICVPGGLGTDPLMEDPEVLDFLRRQAEGAAYVTSVCTGALVLGAAGLLKGYRATTHWNALSALPLLGAEVVRERVVVDRNRMTGGGVTAGIDLGLTVVAEMFGRPVAEFVQLRLEYNPQPPFDAGSPDTAPAEVVASTRARMEAARLKRMEIAARIAERQG